MANFFTEDVPSDNEAVKLGAQRIRETREILNVMATAMFATLTDSASTFLPRWVTGAMIKNSATVDADRAINTDWIKDVAVTEAKLATGAVTADKIGAGAVTENKIANGAVTTDKLANDAVTTDKIADDAVTAAQIADGAVTPDKLSAGAGMTESVEVSLVSSGRTEIAHGFAATPAKVRWVARCMSTDATHPTGTEFDLSFIYGNSLTAVVVAGADATNVWISNNSPSQWYIPVGNGSSAVFTNMNPANWVAVCYYSLV